ncbi:MAG: SMC-Scp complex subunit ScpB [Planctomycetes bacterium]|jgi:segregation and condensation protein B|nr:SMC-Scp complex subunit ScpB [Planctomycetota bacterium]MBT6453520.1 SMC-Scp complex subunit ScpB [Planctomycetota bacterium]MBT6541738.1 SMC-Scp complex subunit ScpB [Planctomycetota bacterium]MBT6784037.1 SMC-Scp complex subunit ScpB [Planctomycetota bacterium]MBT6967858.1 SMC-Scp complex subunit ScpB [Planctomycetota bacterium]
MISRDTQDHEVKDTNGDRNPLSQDAVEETAEVVLEGETLQSTIEAILFASAEPVSRRRLNAMLKEAPKGSVKEALLALEAQLITTSRGYLLHEDGAGLRLLTKPEFAPYVARLRGERRRIRLSSAAFETLAVIAYRQPVRRSDLEAVRGVQCGPILKNLMEWGLVRVVGQDDSIGRPLLYGTTSEFLELLGLSGLDALPEPERLREQGSDRGLEILDGLLEGESPQGVDSEEDPPSSSSGKEEAPNADAGATEKEAPTPEEEDLDDWVPDGWVEE